MTKQQQQFNEWAGANYEAIKQRVMLSCYWDEDVFHDTFIALYQELQVFDEPSMADTFVRAYKRLQGNKHWGDFVYVQPDEVYFSFLQQPSADEEREELARREQRYQTFDKIAFLLKSTPRIAKRDKQLFQLHFLNDYSLHNLAEVMSMSENTITRSINSTLGVLRSFIAPPENTIYQRVSNC